ncbi:hypothetical protein NC652_036908 [Populus alba x Populus x berolinensis]|uniref:Uncharacterized protein n=1 Tax=Populus alba x Populus x berolinensis TaxID=444605 RepID=A0AAD6LKQ2_9ROSI|nr:hypothetical protein NC651_035766 [Populus alba x Populus x berolinensis]KAJ6871383.1 hypothetical protein NC652_036908 [Populus alba x Populus x berolinensis]KAJ6968913.1 hypothetical protein NC653_036781 [Populus alba x Populus x berolinensis]
MMKNLLRSLHVSHMNFEIMTIICFFGTI